MRFQNPNFIFFLMDTWTHTQTSPKQYAPSTFSQSGALLANFWSLLYAPNINSLPTSVIC